jgi:hypothetical protein
VQRTAWEALNKEDARGRLFHAALGLVTLRTAPRHPALDVLHGHLDSWRGVLW